MKNIGIYIYIVLAGTAMLSSCSDFEKLNIDPKAANSDQVQTEYFLNNSIVGAQQDPNISERIFVLSWSDAGRQTLTSPGGLPVGSPNDDYATQYYRDYLSSWMMSTNTAIKIANQQITAGTAAAYVNNLMQCARIWRAYLMSEFTDNFGPCSLDGFTGVTPTFSSEKSCYEFMLSELKDATLKLNLSVKFTGANSSTDHAYGWDFSKWQKYGNSLRMRFAMRISNAEPTLAKQEFEDAVAKPYIATSDDIYQVAEQPGWNALTGVMSREWDDFFITPTMNNLMIGLGGVTTQESIGSLYDLPSGAIKPDNYYGVKYASHFSTVTNDPTAGFYFDGLYNTIDPRAYSLFQIPGNNNTKKGKYDPNYCYYPSWTTNQITQTFKLYAYTAGNGHGASANSSDITLDASYTWNPYPFGKTGIKGSNNDLIQTGTGLLPCLRQQFRNSTNKRVFFAAWESDFLIAEAAVKGWTVPMSGQAAYELGITESFKYNGQSALVAKYIASTTYNRVGTSVSWNHTVEAPAQTFTYKDGYTGATGTYTWTKPANTIYGPNNNDLLNKIITQKFIAQTPWLPLETWSDQRRLGLPFFENPTVEDVLIKLPDLTASTALTGNRISFFPQRFKYPSYLPTSSPIGYNQAVNFLSNKTDAALTPLWWAKQQ